MSLPPLLMLDSETDYRKHYESTYCRRIIITADNIRIYFHPQKFGHAFYENSQNKPGAKDIFSPIRAQRMDWIKATLTHPKAKLFFGWNKEQKTYEYSRRVSVIYEEFVVIVEMRVNKKDELKGNFITCYAADRSINSILNSPTWNKELCLEHIRENGR